MASNTAVNGKQLRSKASKDIGSSKVIAAPAATPTDSSEPLTTPTTTGRPDKAAYDAEQLSFKSQIDALQPKLVSRRPVVTFLSVTNFPCPECY